MWDTFEEDMADAAGWRSVLDACPETAAVRLERPRLDAGEPWCVTQLAGLQFYDYDAPGLADAPIRPEAGDRLGLTRRPDNRADRNAVEVWLRNEHMLGHLPRDLAAQVAPHLDRGASLRAYALGPGTGRAWSVRALLVGTPVVEEHGAWLRALANETEWRLQRAERAAEERRRAEGEAFARDQERGRLERLAQAVRAFERVPLDPALAPSVGEAHAMDVLAERLGLSERRLWRLVLGAGACLTTRKWSRRARPLRVVITPALRAALLAWCAAPTSRDASRALAAVIYTRTDDPDIPF